MVVRAEEVISHEQRADLMLIWNEAGEASVPKGAFRRLWAVLPKLTVVEYKSRMAPPEPGVFDQLLAYGHIVARTHRQTIGAPSENLALVLATAKMSPTIRREAAMYELRIVAHGGGLYRLEGALIATWLMALDEVTIDVVEPLIGYFGSLGLAEVGEEGERWLAERYMSNAEQLKSLPGGPELEEQLLKSPAVRAFMRRRLQERPADVVVDELMADLSEEAKAELLRRLQANDDA